MTKGIRSTPELAKRLEESKVGIICLTRDNLKEPWILFEAGAISKTTGAYAFTFLLDITHGDVEYPLAQFQHTLADEADVRRLVRDINTAVEEAGGRALPERNLDEIFDTFWPQLQAKLQTIAQQADQPQASTRPQGEVLEELLELVRAQDRRSRAQAITSDGPLEEGVAYVVNNGVLRRIKTAWWQHKGSWELVELPRPGDSMRSEGVSERETPAQSTGKNHAPARVKRRRPPRGGGPRT
jgi:hypothetical protein